MDELYVLLLLFEKLPTVAKKCQPASTYPKSVMDTPEQCVKSVQS